MRGNAQKSKADDLPGIERVERRPDTFQRREWIAQRVGWTVLALILLAAMAGLFGRGPLANQLLENEAASFEYERFVRRSADTRWELTLRKAAGGTTEIAIDSTFASHFEIRSIHPEPSSSTLSGGQWIYGFETRAGEEARVSFVVLPQKTGRHSGTLSVSGAPAFQVSQLVYP